MNDVRFAIGGASLMLTLAGCGAVGVQSESASAPLGVSATTTPIASTTQTSTLSGRPGLQQDRVCLHCAP